MASAQPRIPLWLDVDTGHDDAYALLLGTHDPNVELLGVSTVHGNAPLEQTTFNTRSILEALGRRDVRVHPGAAKPIFREVVHASDIHGESGLDGVTLLPQPTTPAVSEGDYLEAMYESLKATPANTAWLVSTGTLTNIGLVFQKFPDLAKHIKGLSIMGGAIGGGFTAAPMGKIKGEGERFGNWTAYAEFNIYCDPEAAQLIFTNPDLIPKTTLIPLDLSHQVLGTREVRRGLLFGSDQPLDPSTADTERTPSPLRALFAQIISFFAGTYAEVFALTEGPPLHDPLAAAAAIHPALFDDHDGERFRVDVVTEGVHSVTQADAGELGRTKVTKLPAGEGGCRIPRTLNVPKFWELIESYLKSADKVTPMEKIPREKLEQEGVFNGIF